MLFQTSDRGGALVYRRGLGVVKVKQAPAQDPFAQTAAKRPSSAAPSSGKMETVRKQPSPAQPPESRLQRKHDGSLVWQPVPTDRKVLGTILQYASQNPDNKVSILPPQAGQQGLRLNISGRAILVLPETFSDVKVRARLQLDSFEGTVGVVHHMRSNWQGLLFACSTKNNRAYLYKLTGKNRMRKLDSARRHIPRDRPFVLTVTGYGRHHKGFLDKQTIVHGHISSGKPGAVGLYFSGRGVVFVQGIQVIPHSPKSQKVEDHNHQGSHDHGGHEHGGHDHGSHEH